MSEVTATSEAAQPVVAADAAVASEPTTVAVEEKTEEKTKETAEKTEEKNEEKADEKTEEKTEEKAEEKTENAAPVPAKGRGKAVNNSKFDPSTLPESEDHSAIQTQVHFYFSDSNLPTDKYLWELTGGSENKPVELQKICQFGRMRRFKSYETVVAALRQSKFVVVSGEAGAELVARKNPYNPDRPRSKIDAATVYVKGFGDEEPTTQFDLEAFFTKYGTVNAVRLRRTAENLFKGSVFVEFADAEQAEKFLALDPQPKWKDEDLKIMSKSAYVAEKSQLIREGKIEPNTNSAPRFFEGRTLGGRRGNHRGGRGGSHSFDKDDWKKRRDDDRKNGFRGGRGGRGRGRGNWGNNSNGHRNGQQNGQSGQRNGLQNGKPVIQSTDKSTENKGEVVSKTENGAGVKRSREEDGSNGTSEPAAKKIDAKADTPAVTA